MKPFPIPVTAFGPGSQDEDETLQYLHMPSDMAVFRPPPLPEATDARALDEVRAFLSRLVAAMREQPFGVPRFELGGLDAAAMALLNQTLGEGEVSVIVRAPRRLDIQETAFAGVWRVRETDGAGRIVVETVEVCPIPSAVIAAAQICGERSLEVAPRPAEELMNASALLAEISDHAASWRPGRPPHVVNLTLLPVSPQDIACLARTLGAGPATILSRGYGNCRISSTRLANAWRVQYFNSMDTLILDTIEVTDMPEVALAAPEDCAESAERLAEWLESLAAE